MTLAVLQPPAALPLDLAEVRRHLRLDTDDEDGLLALYVAAAAKFAEHQTSRTLLATRYVLILPAWPCGPVTLPTSPLIAVRTVEYAPATGGAYQQMDLADCIFGPSAEPKVWPKFAWPSVEPSPGAIRITFDAGYATPISVDTGAGTIAPDLWASLVVGDMIHFRNSGGALPPPLIQRRAYYVHALSGAGFSVRADVGGVAPLSLADGSGLSTLGAIPDGILHWMLIRIETMHSCRGEMEMASGSLSPMPYADRLLDPYRVYCL